MSQLRYVPCEKLVCEDGKTCGKPVKVEDAGSLSWCPEHRARLPRWPR